MIDHFQQLLEIGDEACAIQIGKILFHMTLNQKFEKDKIGSLYNDAECFELKIPNGYKDWLAVKIIYRKNYVSGLFSGQGCDAILSSMSSRGYKHVSKYLEKEKVFEMAFFKDHLKTFTFKDKDQIRAVIFSALKALTYEPEFNGINLEIL